MNRLSLQPNKQHQKMAICYKELDSIKDIFNEKEKELSVAMAKVDALTRQLDELKNGNIINSYSISTKNSSNFVNSIASNCQINNSNYNLELEKLKQELLYRNKLNEKLDEEMILKQKKIDQRKVELNNIDQRINELQSRLSRKRTLNQQLNAQIKSHLLKTENNQSKAFNDNLNNENDVPNCVSILKANLRRSIGAGQPYKFTHLKPLNTFEPLKRQPKSEVDLNTNSTSDKNSKETNFLSSNHHHSESEKNSTFSNNFEPKIATPQIKNYLTTNSDSLNYDYKNKNVFQVNDYKNECNSNYDKNLLYNSYIQESTKIVNKNQNSYNQKTQSSNESYKSDDSLKKNQNYNKQILDNSNKEDKINDNYNENSQSLPNHRLNAINNTAKYLIVDRKNDQRELISDYEKTNVLKKQISSPAISETSLNNTTDFVSSFSSPNLNSTFNINPQNKISANDSNYRFSKNNNNRDEHGIEKGHVLKSVQQLQQTFEKKNHNNLNNVNNSLEINNDQSKTDFDESIKSNKQNQKSQLENNFETNKSELSHQINENFNYGSIMQATYKNNTDSESDLSSETSTSVNYKIPKSSSLKNFVDKNNELNNENNEKALKVKDSLKNCLDNSDWLRKRRPLVADINLEEHFEKINSSYNQDLDLNQAQKNVNENTNSLNLKTEKDSYFGNLCNSNVKNLNGDDFISSNSSSGHSPTSLEDLSSNKMEFRNVIRNIMCKNLGSSSDKSSTMSEEETDEDDENSVDCKANINDKKTIKSLSSKNDVQEDKIKTKDNQKCNLKSNANVNLNNSIVQSDESTGEKENSENSNIDTSQNEDHLDNCIILDDKISKINSSMKQDSDHEVLKRTKSNLKKHFGKNKRRVSFDPLALFLDAALEGELELVKKTATQVSNPSASSEGITALHNAICAGHFDIVKFLVEIGCDVNAQDHDGWTPLHCAASCNNLPMVKYLVEHGACIFAVTWNDHETPAQKCEEMEDGYHGCSQYLYNMQEKLGDTNGDPVYAVYDYNAQQPDELSFKCRDKIKILDKSDENESEWWWASIDHKTGYVPRNLLSIYPRVIPKPKETL